MVKNSPGNAADTRDTGLMPGFVRCPGEGNGHPLQCSCLEISMDRGAWWATVHRIGKSGTQLSRSHKDHRRSNMYIVGSLPGSLNDPCLLCRWKKGKCSRSVVSNSLWSHGLEPGTVTCQFPLSMELFRQEYWSGLPFPSSGELPDPGIEPRLPAL